MIPTFTGEGVLLWHPHPIALSRVIDTCRCARCCGRLVEQSAPDRPPWLTCKCVGYSPDIVSDNRAATIRHNEIEMAGQLPEPLRSWALTWLRWARGYEEREFALTLEEANAILHGSEEEEI